MGIQSRSRIAFVVSAMALAACAQTQAPSTTPDTIRAETAMMNRAVGEFDVKVLPQAADEGFEAVGRMLLDKQFHGDLEAASKGQMLAVGTAVKGSAGYVAMEQVTGTLKGRAGTFVLQHSGTMNRGEPQLSVTVVPDSGTGELAGLTGRMDIIIEGGKHSYVFEYALNPEAEK